MIINHSANRAEFPRGQRRLGREAAASLTMPRTVLQGWLGVLGTRWAFYTTAVVEFVCILGRAGSGRPASIKDNNPWAVRDRCYFREVSIAEMPSR